jgi:hypothetical protein
MNLFTGRQVDRYHTSIVSGLHDFGKLKNNGL